LLKNNKYCLPFNLWVKPFCSTNTRNKNNLFKVATFDPADKFSAIFSLMTLKPIIIKLTTFQLCSKTSKTLNSYTTAFIHSKINHYSKFVKLTFWAVTLGHNKDVLVKSYYHTQNIFSFIISLWWLSYHYQFWLDKKLRNTFFKHMY